MHRLLYFLLVMVLTVKVLTSKRFKISLSLEDSKFYGIVKYSKSLRINMNLLVNKTSI